MKSLAIAKLRHSMVVTVQRSREDTKVFQPLALLSAGVASPPVRLASGLYS
jgi:hypothetical protein